MKKFPIILVLLFVCSFSFGQTTNSNNNINKSFNDKLFTGGNLSLSFGTITYIEFSPILGYRFNDHITAGIGGTYQYYRDRSYASNILETHIYGGNLFGRVYFLQDFFIHAEYEVLSMETKFWDPYQSFYNGKRFLIGNALAGVGYRQALGAKVFTNIMLLYNFNETIFSPYSNPVIKVGIDIGL
jgi:hypothetical protein